MLKSIQKASTEELKTELKELTKRAEAIATELVSRSQAEKRERVAK